MRLNGEEGNDASLAGRTSQNTARIARIPIDTSVCRYFLRSILHYAIDHADGFIDRIL
jgi:hypothetical protein